MIINKNATQEFISSFWDKEIIPKLSEYISIPCKTPALDPEWQKNGYLQKAAELVVNWVKTQNIPGTKAEIITLPEKAPFVFVDIPGKSDKTVLFYGHLDKMPETEGWLPDLGAWKPVLKNDCLYGRGGADDGYAAFAPIAAIKALQAQGIPHARCVMLLEGAEECGSVGFEEYLTKLDKAIGTPDVIVINDSDASNYDQIWCTTSLRGIVAGDLTVEILKEGVHSGVGSGIAPSTFRIIRQLLSRLEDEKSGKLKLKDLHVKIPAERMKQAKQLAKILGTKVYKDLPFVQGAQPLSKNVTELLLNQTWRPTLCVIGAAGIPLPADAGNVLRPSTTLKLSVRIPPNCNPEKIKKLLKKTFEKNPPHGAKVTFTPGQSISGWNAPSTAPWLAKALDEASLGFFGKKTAYMGMGGGIGVVMMMGEKYPNVQFVVSGAAGPNSNAHGPNELLYIPVAKKYTCCIAEVLAAHCTKK
jgi:acetylornithine deacetylase/succinyl-diaminopimelate desuccinylase-like protein